ncbi:MAG: hypothetical protein H3C35_06070 [Bacteroidetes bacterium]|nr:hypothetical protein [Bacteroidota bacterium]
MSWIFGILYSDDSQAQFRDFTPLHGSSLKVFQKENEYYLAIGGNPQTCHFDDVCTDGVFFAGVGTLLKRKNGATEICPTQTWKALANNPSLYSSLEGHFVLLTYTNGSVTIRTDRIGLRTIFWAYHNDSVVISTRLDWITRYCGGCSIDYGVVGSRWILANQFSYKSLVHNIHRLGPNGELVYKNKNIACTQHSFEPDACGEYSIDDIISLIKEYAIPSQQNERRLTLGLSGGLDSRLLLSCYLNSKFQNFQTHTFGNIEHPDAAIPKAMGEREKFLYYFYNKPIPEASEIIPELNGYLAQTNLVESAATFLRLRNYRDLESQNILMIDGGFGEIARRQYLNRIAYRGASIIREKNIEAVLSHLKVNRASIFSHELTTQMENGSREEINFMLHSMPDVDKIGLENYMDLWAIRSRFPNFGSDEQARLDSFILNYMPFAQPQFLNMVFFDSTSLEEKRKTF